VIDYVLVSGDDFEKVEDMEVCTLVDASHMPITLKWKIEEEKKVDECKVEGVVGGMRLPCYKLTEERVII
jgi:hypothetical protein